MAPSAGGPGECLAVKWQSGEEAVLHSVALFVSRNVTTELLVKAVARDNIWSLVVTAEQE